ncbi:LysR substrate-binding domain-containing protein [Litoribrevibacter albus]|uniref:LysR family transcriptional regulator n=1 Tax=Litoribrevibacter albus TaxID=1473156 RepID=A0AA37SE35_9GAMM|nr:LysR substrate-binding domain-containing protein [Litoribrevibacter albus]GLQ33335.1 LysR family transcriptional regulator [Litoribrevibacter albus]
MELSDLKVFCAVAEQGGVIRAAEQLHRVPSNVTARIQKLESELGRSLFHRDRNRLKISPAGEQLLSYAKRILSLADQAIEQFSSDQPSGVLRVGSMEAVAASRLSAILYEYHTAYPDVSLEVKTRPTGDLIEFVLNGQLDVALVADPNADERLERMPVFKETLVLVSEKSMTDISDPSQLGVEPTLLGFSNQCAYRNRLTQWVKQVNLVAKVVEINSYHTLLNCVTAGMGVGLVPEKLLELYPFAKDLRTHPLPDNLATTITTAIWRKDSSRPSVSAYLDILKGASNLT